VAKPFSSVAELLICDPLRYLDALLTEDVSWEFLMIRNMILAVVLILVASTHVASQDRETKVRTDRTRIETDGYWIYNDLNAGIELAKKTKKPLLVVFRCIPCEHCAQLDEKVVERDPVVQSLLSKFVCVRSVHANGMDLSLFQFDYDQSWAAFFLNADLTIYGRYGTRSHQTESESDVSLEGFAKALTGALELHNQYPQIKESLAAKRGPDSAVSVPEELPSLKGKFGSKLNYEGKVVQSCIHCHQVGEGLRTMNRVPGSPLPDKILYPYPHPKSLGMILDPKEKAKVARVEPESIAAKSGFQAGDELVALENQPLLSIADIQWVLHNTGDTANLAAEVLRNGNPQVLQLQLTKGWRQLSDISWRATSWELRRMATGGLLLEELPAAEREQAKLSNGELALRVKHVGQYGPHAAAKQAGFQKGDILVALNGDIHRITESQLLAEMINKHRPGEKIPVTVLRDGKKVELKLPIQ
jgi:serine protease Do